MSGCDFRSELLSLIRRKKQTLHPDIPKKCLSVRGRTTKVVFDRCLALLPKEKPNIPNAPSGCQRISRGVKGCVFFSTKPFGTNQISNLLQVLLDKQKGHAISFLVSFVERLEKINRLKKKSF